MTITKPSTESANEEKKCLVKSGKVSNHAGYYLFQAFEQDVWRLQTVGLNASSNGFGGFKPSGGLVMV